MADATAHMASDMSLARFQDAFAAALLASDVDEEGPIATLARQPGFAVYRNTVMKGGIDALQANYPAIARLVGEEWFRAAAAVFVRAHPPRLPMLAEYGTDFAGFLAAFEPARELPYLPAVALLDRAWTESHNAADATAPDARVLAQLAPERLAACRLVPHPSARWQWFDAPAWSIWSRNRAESCSAESCGPSTGESDIEWQPEGALLARDEAGAVRGHPLSRGGCAFLDACAAGLPLAEAAAAALETEPALDFTALTTKLFAARALAAIVDPLSTDHCGTAAPPQSSAA